MNLFQAVTGFGVQQPRFKEICTPQQRWKKHLNIVKGSPNHISVVIEKAAHSKLTLKKPYLLFGLQKNCTIHELRENIRRLLQLSDKDSLFLYCKRIKNLERFVEADGFIYFYISEQQAFG